MSKEALKLALEAFSVIAIADNLDWIQHQAEQQAAALREALAEQQPVQQEPWCMKMNGCKTKCEDCPVQVAQPEKAPVAVHQFRLMYSANWYDGHPDPKDGYGPYETRTLYTTPPQRPWVNLPDEEIKILWIQYRAALPRYLCFAKALLARAKEKNT